MQFTPSNQNIGSTKQSIYFYDRFITIRALRIMAGLFAFAVLLYTGILINSSFSGSSKMNIILAFVVVSLMSMIAGMALTLVIVNRMIRALLNTERQMRAVK